MKDYPTKLKILTELTYIPETGVFIRNKPDKRCKNLQAGVINFFVRGLLCEKISRN